ncbi:biotin--[acetyl-CoA-carboxylase] ligase [Bacteroidetes bacterium endosymbiont of Geopemphigus sp.]|uniref:biotin--[acetyl-CoA-carboxylase] ligase n=1 Tax=Bacteroidetes bacterium endosymbiont of Geopemphigus sp. TaxID=2047937 RepID=UPI000CD1DD3A|nr:biotin--[acetyl-CoA-carboxylase] ligase [Bacteroidetes bacterium endosymbiont of Geopemphigus sp.]
MHSFLYPVYLTELDTIDSTQDYLKKSQLHNSPYEWTVAWALKQTKGRGTYGNHWQGEKAKNLTFSFSFRTHLSARKNFLLNICISNGLHKRLSLEGEGFSIKWPNDLLLNGRKIAGILIENQISKGYIQHSVIGTGLNVHQEKFETLSKASSLKNILNKTFILKELLISLLKNLQKEYRKLIQGEEQSLKNYYLLHLFGKNQKNYFKIDHSIYEGEIQGIDKDGRLVVSLAKGTQEYFFPKEIDMIY